MAALNFVSPGALGAVGVEDLIDEGVRGGAEADTKLIIRARGRDVGSLEGFSDPFSVAADRSESRRATRSAINLA
ncbi:MAG TPA: hypothetical protein VJS17_01325 [Pyrinomonadaceae bacterium]|nr:hypothetical protein [Pyrinomonadaceae bacterium]